MSAFGRAERCPKDAPRHFASCDELCAYLARFNDTAILGFSAGKDSVGCWLQLRKHFKRVVPFYLYYVPGISFVRGVSSQDGAPFLTELEESPRSRQEKLSRGRAQGRQKGGPFICEW